MSTVSGTLSQEASVVQSNIILLAETLDELQYDNRR